MYTTDVHKIFRSPTALHPMFTTRVHRRVLQHRLFTTSLVHQFCSPSGFVHQVSLFTRWVVHQVGLFTRWGCSPGATGIATCLFWTCNVSFLDLQQAACGSTSLLSTMSARVPTHRRLEAASEPGRTHRLAGTLPRPTRGRPSQLVKRFASARRKVCSAGVERLQRQPASGA